MAELPAEEIPRNPLRGKIKGKTKKLRPLSKKQLEKLKKEFSIPVWMLKN